MVNLGTYLGVKGILKHEIVPCPRHIICGDECRVRGNRTILHSFILFVYGFIYCWFSFSYGDWIQVQYLSHCIMLVKPFNEVTLDDIIRQVASYEPCNHRLKSTDIRWNVLHWTLANTGKYKWYNLLSSPGPKLTKKNYLDCRPITKAVGHM